MSPRPFEHLTQLLLPVRPIYPVCNVWWQLHHNNKNFLYNSLDASMPKPTGISMLPNIRGNSVIIPNRYSDGVLLQSIGCRAHLPIICRRRPQVQYHILCIDRGQTGWWWQLECTRDKYKVTYTRMINPVWVSNPCSYFIFQWARASTMIWYAVVSSNSFFVIYMYEEYSLFAVYGELLRTPYYTDRKLLSIFVLCAPVPIRSVLVDFCEATSWSNFGSTRYWIARNIQPFKHILYHCWLHVRHTRSVEGTWSITLPPHDGVGK